MKITVENEVSVKKHQNTPTSGPPGTKTYGTGRVGRVLKHRGPIIGRKKIRNAKLYLFSIKFFYINSLIVYYFTKNFVEFFYFILFANS